ncbi:DNA-binding protein inhibitor ID-3-like [Scleropages formosus]|uniref:DNA-binding protein inhibitor ID-3-like n=1 Tax=Scleropages formosus TaxID=113540 RepID=A0A0P7WIX8_SCLFO|nr:DNA-binding protein inhibitor ID-3-like [Scleropages formosus]
MTMKAMSPVRSVRSCYEAVCCVSQQSVAISRGKGAVDEPGGALCDMNLCYSRLKELVPSIPQNRSVSQVEILQHVIDYILDLQTALEAASPEPAGPEVVLSLQVRRVGARGEGRVAEGRSTWALSLTAGPSLKADGAAREQQRTWRVTSPERTAACATSRAVTSTWCENTWLHLRGTHKEDGVPLLQRKVSGCGFDLRTETSRRFDTKAQEKSSSPSSAPLTFDALCPCPPLSCVWDVEEQLSERCDELRRGHDRRTETAGGRMDAPVTVRRGGVPPLKGHPTASKRHVTVGTPSWGRDPSRFPAPPGV